jgi:hypothetical protein
MPTWTTHLDKYLRLLTKAVKMIDALTTFSLLAKTLYGASDGHQPMTPVLWQRDSGLQEILRR